jgi:hypothetical protein
MRTQYSNLAPAVDVAIIYDGINQWFKTFAWDSAKVVFKLRKRARQPPDGKTCNEVFMSFPRIILGVLTLL